METEGERESARVADQIAETNLIELINSFRNSNEKVQLLNSLQLAISKCSRRKLQDDLANVDLQNFFATFPKLNEEEMGLCCEVIDSLFVAFAHEVVIEKYSHELRQGLNVDHPSIQLVCLAELKRIPIDLYERFIFKDESTISSLIHLITCEPLQVGLSAVSALSRIGNCNNGAFRLIDSHLQELETAMAKSDVVRFRFYEMIMNVAAADPGNLPVIGGSGLMRKLVDELFEDDTPDILAQTNCLEILTTLTQTDFGFRWCSDAGILAKIENLFTIIDADSILATLLPSLITFFGCLAKLKPNIICMQYKVFMSSLFSAIESKDMTLKGIAIETVAQIGATADGKKVLQTYDDKLDQFIITIGKALEKSSDMRTRGLTAIHYLIMLKPTHHSPELLTLTKRWFQLLGQDVFKSIFEFCQQPFENVRLAAQTVLLSLAFQPWGQQLMCNYPTFKEYLIDWTMESKQEWKYGKFKIIEALLECNFTKEYFGAEFYQKLVTYRDLGRSYMESGSSVDPEPLEEKNI